MKTLQTIVTKAIADPPIHASRPNPWTNEYSCTACAVVHKMVQVGAVIRAVLTTEAVEMRVLAVETIQNPAGNGRKQPISKLVLATRVPPAGEWLRTVTNVQLYDPASGELLAEGLLLGAACRPGKGLTVWFTGLSGAGKTTIADGVARELETLGLPMARLDGDFVRMSLSRDLGFSSRDREENIRRLCAAAKTLMEMGRIVLVSAISPRREPRRQARESLPPFLEVFVNAPLSVCEERDVKGLYRRARLGEVTQFTGISDVYEPPLNAEVECRTDKEPIPESVRKVVSMVLERIRPSV